MKRIFWIVLDSAGIGEAPDADKFGDVGSNTWKSCYDSGKLHIPNMEKIGIYQIDGMEYAKSTEKPTGSFARMQELSCGKDIYNLSFSYHQFRLIMLQHRIHYW